MATRRTGRLDLRDPAHVQRRREWPTRFIQAGAAFAQRNILPRLLRSEERIHIPRLVRLLYRIPVVRDLPARMLGFRICCANQKSSPAGPVRCGNCLT